jgi:hypothetical protein
MHQVKFRTRQDFDSAIALVEDALECLPAVRRSHPETSAPAWHGWRSPLYEAETGAGTMRYQADIESTHIRIRAIPPDGKCLPEPFRLAIPTGAVCISHLDGKALMNREAIAEFLDRNLAALRSVMLGRDLPKPQSHRALDRQLREAFETEPPPATTALFADGSATMFAALLPLRMKASDDCGKATPEQATMSLASRTTLIVDELCRCAGRYSAEAFRSATEHAHLACRGVQAEFGPGARKLAGDPSAHVNARIAALDALHLADVVERRLDRELFNYSLDERPTSMPAP